MNLINIGTEINLQDLIQSRMLIQANSGGGKSALARTIIEQSFGKVPFIILDKEGEYYTLKEKFGDILIIGGSFADVPINLKSAALLPKEIISNRLSVIIDLSDLKSDEKRRYVKLFLESMMNLTKDYWIAYLVFIEEAHFFCGEQDKYESGPAVKELMSAGRKRGYCGILITQRISKLHKDAAAEANNKFIGRTVLDIDMDRSARELGFSNSKDRLQLRDLQPGHFFAFGTSIEPVYVHEVTINLPQTKLPKAGSDLHIQTKKPTDKIKAVLTKLNDLPQEAAKELKTMQDLQSEVNRLKAELLKATKSGNSLQPAKDANQIEILKEQQLKLKAELINKDKKIESGQKALNGYLAIIKGITRIIEKDVPAIPISEPINIVKTVAPVYKSFVEHNKNFADKVYQKVNENNSSNGSLPPGERKILIAAAQYPNGLTRNQLTVIAGFKRSSRDAYIARLKQKSYILQNGERIVPSEEGLNFLGPSFEKLPTGTALQEYWQSNLPPGEWKILEAAINNFPDSVTRDALTELTGFLRSSRDAYIARLKTKELIITPAAGEIKAAEILFD